LRFAGIAWLSTGGSCWHAFRFILLPFRFRDWHSVGLLCEWQSSTAGAPIEWACLSRSSFFYTRLERIGLTRSAKSWRIRVHCDCYRVSSTMIVLTRVTS